MGVLVKMLGAGLGMASEAIHQARAERGNNGNSGNSGNNGNNQYVSNAAAASSSSYPPRGPPSNYRDTPPEYVEVADEAAAAELVRSGRAERVTDFSSAQEKKAPLDRYREDYDYDDDSDADTNIGDDEAVWELDELAEQMEPPAYRESEAFTAAEAEAMASQPEEVKARREEQMARDLAHLAGPAPRSPVPRLPCPVIVPQRRPRNKDRGFVRAYAPVLAQSGIGQDVFIKFINDLDMAAQSDKWIDVVYLSAGIVGFVPEAGAQIASAVVQVVAGTAREMQSRARRNSYLEMVNERIFMPRGLFVMIMAFKDEIPSQAQRGPLTRLAASAGQGLFSSERLNIDQTAAKFSNPNSNMSSITRNLQKMRLNSGSTYTTLELPQAAELVYPGLDNAVKQQLAGDGKGKQKAGMKDKLTGSMRWVGDYLDRREQAIFAAQHPDSALAVPLAKPFASRFSDPTHPANSGSLIALLTGGAIDPTVRRIENRAWKDERRIARHEYKDERRIARGKSPRGSRKRDLQPRGPDGKRQKSGGIIHKILHTDVLYLMVVNLPSQEEVRQDVARLEHMLARR